MLLLLQLMLLLVLLLTDDVDDVDSGKLYLRRAFLLSCPIAVVNNESRGP